MKTEYNVGWSVRVTNRIMKNLGSFGFLPDRFQILIVPGRKSGRITEIHLCVVETPEKKWLVAPYGPVNWVKNVRAAKQIKIRKRCSVREYIPTEITAKESAPVIKKYLEIEKHPKDYVQVNEHSPLSDIEAEAHRYPVFALEAVNN